jgi:hypothetical protein
MNNDRQMFNLEKLMGNEKVGIYRPSFDDVVKIELVSEEFNGRVGLTPVYIRENTNKISREQQDAILQNQKTDAYLKNPSNYLRGSN